LNRPEIGQRNTYPGENGREGWRKMGRVLAQPANPTTLLLAWGRGDQAALGRLLPLVHDELRRLARRHMARERVGHTLQATALVNEAYLRLIEITQVRWQNRAHFFAMASRVMRRILVDSARARRYQKRGGGAEQVSLDEALLVSKEPAQDLVALDAALDALAALDSRRSQVVEMRFFGGLSVKETAEALHVSADTVMRDWRLAKVWLLRELSRMEA
jgi:RNA polymerase sigma-70 factor (ECF subfamily)